MGWKTCNNIIESDEFYDLRPTNPRAIYRNNANKRPPGRFNCATVNNQSVTSAILWPRRIVQVGLGSFRPPGETKNKKQHNPDTWCMIARTGITGVTGTPILNSWVFELSRKVLMHLVVCSRLIMSISLLRNTRTRQHIYVEHPLACFGNSFTPPTQMPWQLSPGTFTTKFERGGVYGTARAFFAFLFKSGVFSSKIATRGGCLERGLW